MENLALSLQRALQEDYGYEFLTLTSSLSDRNPSERSSDPVQIRRLRPTFNIYSTPIGLDWHNRIRQLVNEFDPQLILAHTPVPGIADLAVRVAVQAGIPSIVMYHGDLVAGTIPKRIAVFLYWSAAGRRTLGLCDSVFATSPAFAHSSPVLRQYLDKVEIVPPFVDANVFQRKDSSQFRREVALDDAPVVLFVAQLERANVSVKGLDVLMRAMTFVLKEIPQSVLVIVGNGTAAREYAALARRLGIATHVRFLGTLPRESLPVAYSAADVVCFPSVRGESLGLVLLEAQACGTPVVASEIGGVPDIVRSGETGILVRPGDPDSLADALLRLLGSDTLMTTMGHHAQVFVRSVFTQARSAAVANTAMLRAVGSS